MKCLISRTYTIDFLHEDVMRLYISTGSGYWTFLFAKEGADLSPVNVTFNIDMSNTETSLSEGVFLMGGDAFGSPGDNPMTHAPELGEHVYTITKQISARIILGNYVLQMVLALVGMRRSSSVVRIVRMEIATMIVCYIL